MMVAIAVSCRPSVGSYPDGQGRLALGMLQTSGIRWSLVAQSGFSAETSYSGTVSNASVLSTGLQTTDIGLRYTITLTGSGTPSTSYLRIYRRAGIRLAQWLAIPIDMHVGEGACCESGQSSVVTPTSYSGAPAYAVSQVGYVGPSMSVDRFALPGEILYVAGNKTYLPVTYVDPGRHQYPIAMVPVVAALKAQQSDPMTLQDPARVYLPGAAPSLTLPGTGAGFAHLYVAWSPSSLRLTIQTSAAWPAKEEPVRIDAYAGSYNGKSVSHVIYAGAKLPCRAGIGYGGEGYECTVTLPATGAWSSSAQPESNVHAATGADHQYGVAGVTRLALRLLASGEGAMHSYALDPGTGATLSGRLSAVLLLYAVH
jgi:hypothetical protein